jgi:pimeloyl-ACP methyl ester carboxylesterase
MRLLGRMVKGIMKGIAGSLFCVALLSVGAPLASADEFDSGGVRIHYLVKGEGPPVILIHGLTSSARMNWDLPGITADLAKHHQVVELDCRGHGQSGKPDAEGSYGTNMVEDVVRLLDHLHIEKAQIVGYSMGGMITMKLLATHPERVISAVLAGMGWVKADAPMSRFWELANDSGRLNVPVACLHGFAALGITEQELKSIKVPVTVIVGDRDPTRRWYVEPLGTARPDWPVHIVTNAGHLNCVAKPDFTEQLGVALDRKTTANAK